MTTVPPVHREIIVDAPVAVAFEIFTARLDRWWPVAQLSVFGAGGTVTLAGGQIVERAADGRSTVWGTITRWEPPAALAFTWHPGRSPGEAGQVTVTFATAGTDEAGVHEPGVHEAGIHEAGTAGTGAGEPDRGEPDPGRAPQTLVTLEHSGWEAFADPLAARAEYDHGWPPVLRRYRDVVGQDRAAGKSRAAAGPSHAAAGQDGEATGQPGDSPDARDAANVAQTWVALLHRPGPAAPAHGSLQEDPRFAEHVAFLIRMRDAGYLVAAGPLDDAAGEGMTVLRLPGADQFEHAARLARQDDASVAQGFFTVAVRPWHVMMRERPGTA